MIQMGGTLIGGTLMGGTLIGVVNDGGLMDWPEDMDDSCVKCT